MTTSSSPARAGTAAHSDVSVLLRRHGLRCTPIRLHTLAMLGASGLHLSAAEIASELQRLAVPFDPATVYRTLEALTAAGLTHAVHAPGPKRYGASTAPHHHTVCERCGQVGALASEHLREAMERITELTGLRPGVAGSLLVYGLCACCSA
ncbi:Fur family transcriptional regulator [Streptomyces sp. NPDC059070]|uniref:Fur family transcriptional regulator n=1 Tax=unclassified Streptomyces TaxID=2593676 RepID=UPI0034E1B9CA